MRTTVLSAVLFSLAFLSCNFCTKKVPCPEFHDETLESWFPLQNRKAFTFKASNGEIKTYAIDSVFTSQPYTTEQNRGSACYADQQAISKEKNAQGRPLLAIKLQSEHPFYESGTQKSVFVQLLGLSFKGTDLAIGEGFRQVINESHGGTGMLKNLPSIQLGGKTFNNVQSIYFDTISNLPKAPVHKVYIANNHGIIAYETYRPFMLWVREE